jgi:hypothetical protein
MGFGKKTDFLTGRVLDLDKTYKNIIQPAVEAAGLKCMRADEIVHSGLIDLPMYEQLLNAEVVVADLSTSNATALYELGVRHALRPYTTVVIAEDGFRAFPFDVNHVPVRLYRHLGEGIEFTEVMRFREELTAAIVKMLSGPGPRQPDSPVYAGLPGLNPPTFHPTATGETTPESADKSASTASSLTQDVLMQAADVAQKNGDFQAAKKMFTAIRQMTKTEGPEDPHLIQRLALVTYKSRYPSEQAALEEARDLLLVIDPVTSNDTETLGLWGSVHKRLWDLTKDPTNLDVAVRAYERGFYLRNDYYNGINFAFLLNVRATHTADRAEAVADFVQARRVRKEVISICEQWLASNPAPDEKAGAEAKEQYLQSKYWVLASMAEAYVGVADEARAQATMAEADSTSTPSWMTSSTREQLDVLRRLLADSPLKSL